MNMDDGIFEERLRKIKPSAPSPELMTRLKNTMPPVPAQTKHLIINFPDILRLALPLAAAALLVVGLGIHFTKTLNAGKENQAASTATSPPKELIPLQSTDCLLGAREVGVIRSPDGRPYRVVQSVGIGQETVEDPESGKLVTRMKPQQQILLVSMNTF